MDSHGFACATTDSRHLREQPGVLPSCLVRGIESSMSNLSPQRPVLFTVASRHRRAERVFLTATDSALNHRKHSREGHTLIQVSRNFALEPPSSLKACRLTDPSHVRLPHSYLPSPMVVRSSNITTLYLVWNDRYNAGATCYGPSVRYTSRLGRRKETYQS